MNSIEFGATARWYPTGRRFFADISVGYNIFRYPSEVERYDEYTHHYEYWYEDIPDSGFCFAPGFGWTIDTGQMGGFFLSPGVKVPMTLGGRGFKITIAPYLGLGIAF
jgi:hypothetical protein